MVKMTEVFTPNTAPTYTYVERARSDALAQTIADPHQSTSDHFDRGYQHSFGHAESWAKEFDDPARDAWQKPAEVLDAIHLEPTARVADLGAGTGYFSAR